MSGADDAGRVEGEIRGVISGAGEHWTAEYRFRRADGGYADILDRGYVLRDDRGRAVAAAAKPPARRRRGPR